MAHDAQKEMHEPETVIAREGPPFRNGILRCRDLQSDKFAWLSGDVDLQAVDRVACHRIGSEGFPDIGGNIIPPGLQVGRCLKLHRESRGSSILPVGEGQVGNPSRGLNTPCRQSGTIRGRHRSRWVDIAQKLQGIGDSIFLWCGIRSDRCRLRQLSRGKIVIPPLLK